MLFSEVLSARTELFGFLNISRPSKSVLYSENDSVLDDKLLFSIVIYAVYFLLYREFGIPA